MPHRLLVNLASAVVVVALILGVGNVALEMDLPSNLGGFALGTAALFSVGLLIAAGRDRLGGLLPDARAPRNLGGEQPTSSSR